MAEQKIIVEAAQGASAIVAIEVATFVTVFVLGFVVGIARAWRHDERGHWSYFVSVGTCSGALSFGIAAVYYAFNPGTGGFGWGLVGSSPLIALGGRQLEAGVSKIAFRAIEKLALRFGLLDEEKEDVAQ